MSSLQSEMLKCAEEKTLFDGLLKGDGITNLTMGAPGEWCLKQATGVLAKTTTEFMKLPDAQSGLMLQYGPRMGAGFYRTELSKMLSLAYQEPVDSEHLLLSAGATSGLHLIASQFFPTGSTIIVEQQTYFIAHKIFTEDLGYNVVTVRQDNEGTDVADLDRVLTEQRALSKHTPTESRPFWAMVYLVPVFCNPTGVSTSPERCQQLVELARKHDVMVFCDDVYNLLHYDDTKPAPPRLLHYDNMSDPGYKSNVVSNGSFTKIFAPGVRVGWVEAQGRIMDIMKKTNIIWSGGAVNHYTSQLLAVAMQKGWCQDLLKKLNAEYGLRMKSVCNILRTHLPEGCSFDEPEGGYFVWIAMPAHAKSTDLKEHTKKQYSIEFLCGPDCSPIGSGENALRIAISFYELPFLEDSTKKLCTAITEYLASLKK